ncbi:disease resistance protein TAO1-like [Eucalyptus grandis]|uniref:disease resistance protein TAO1-like n=1 Tax=Eucalyptus grandis TaxID=71139 RepID=UPI00192EB65D|nr:disease resistance protein TAO1-like [Eucalyptus grandis]
MRSLRLLILRNVSFQGPICLPNGIRWFEWPGAPSIPEFASGPNKLVGLDLSESRMTIVPKPLEEFRQLKHINFSFCNSLVHVPDISFAPNLEELKFMRCINLVGAHESIANHDKLRNLIILDCFKLRNLTKELKSKNLEFISFAGCKNFEMFPDIPHKVEGLEVLNLVHTAIKELPASIGNLISLEIAYLNGCSNLVGLPSNIYKLQNLRILGLAGCKNLVEFPKLEDSADPCIEAKLPKLQYIYLRRSDLCMKDVLENLSRFPSLIHPSSTKFNF